MKHIAQRKSTRAFFCLIFSLLSCIISFSQSTEVLLKQAQDSIEKKDYDAALRDLNAILSDKPKNIDALSQRARVYYFQKKFKEANADATRVIELNPKKTAIVWNVLGLIESEEKKYQDAIDFFSRSINVDPTFAKAYYNRALAKEKRNVESKYVLEDYDAYLKLEPKDLNVLKAAGGYCLDKGFATCAAYFQTLKTLSPDSSVGYYGYALAYANNNILKVKDDENLKAEVLQNFRQAMELDPKNSKIPEQLGRFYGRLRQYDESINALTQALAIKPQNDWALAMRGDSYLYKKDYDAAIADYTKALEINPKRATAYQYRAYAQREKGISQKTGYETATEKTFWQTVAGDYRKYLELGEQSNENLNNLQLFLSTIPPYAPKPWLMTAEGDRLAPQLYAAVERKDIAAALDLIKKGAQVNYLGGEYKTSTLFEAARTKDMTLVKALLDAGANPNLYHPLYQPISDDDVAMVELFIKYKADVNYVYSTSGTTYLMIAALFAKNPKITALLLEAGANKNAVDDKGHNALYFAERDNKTETAVLLGGSAESTAEAVRKLREESAKKDASAQRAKVERAEAAIDAYNRVHEEVESNIKNYVDAQNKLNKGGDAAFLMKGTQARAYNALQSSARAIEDLLDRYGKRLPKDLYDHILKDYALVGGTRNYDDSDDDY